MRATLKASVSAALIAGVFAIAIASGLVNFPNPVGVGQGTANNFCQESLDFGRAQTSFVFSYKNLGTDHGIFEGGIKSNDVLSKYKGSNEPLQIESSRGWTVEKDITHSFEFIIALPESPDELETITIETNLSCQKSMANLFKIPCGNADMICSYQNKHSPNFGPIYELVS